jgi:hypothetical protein
MRLAGADVTHSPNPIKLVASDSCPVFFAALILARLMEI